MSRITYSITKLRSSKIKISQNFGVVKLRRKISAATGHFPTSPIFGHDSAVFLQHRLLIESRPVCSKMLSVIADTLAPVR